jgi:hypothetical protein
MESTGLSGPVNRYAVSGQHGRGLHRSDPTYPPFCGSAGSYLARPKPSTRRPGERLSGAPYELVPSTHLLPGNAPLAPPLIWIPRAGERDERHRASGPNRPRCRSRQEIPHRFSYWATKSKGTSMAAPDGRLWSLSTSCQPLIDGTTSLSWNRRFKASTAS